MNRREFLQVLAAASASGLALDSREALAGKAPNHYYDLPAFGNVSLMHMTDCHAQLKPIWFREPNVNLGVGSAIGRAPHLVGEHLLKAFNVKPGSRDAHAFSYIDFTAAARTYGKVGGFAHLKTLVDTVRATRPGSLLMDGGDTWQGSATALWTNAQDMVDACIALGVNVMTPHWEMTYGAARVQEIVNGDFKKAGVDFVAQNVVTNDFGDQVFQPYVIKVINGVQVAIIGQAFPYTPIANPRWMVPDWSFGIRDESMQKFVDEARAKGAQVVVVLSHNGMDVDLKMASRVTGIDAIFGGHTQFMPSTFLTTAVDHDGDGRRNIASSAPDALGSTANFLHKAGWRAGERWGFEVKLPSGYTGPSGRRHRQSLSQWEARGITKLDGSGLGEGSAALLLPAGTDGPAFLVTKNFDAIYSYNASDAYALAICVLSDLLRGGHGIQTPWPTDDPGLSRTERRELQALLTRQGYDVGDADGVIGTKSKEAIADFQGRVGLPRNGRASLKVLNALRGR